MRRHLSVACLLLAWLCATGALLDAAQVLAWTRMFVSYARTLPPRQALSRTFDSGQPCEICLAVQKARETGRKQPPATPAAAAKQIVLICQPADTAAPPSSFRAWPEPGRTHVLSWCSPVAVPPPRSRGATLRS
jgi:hypothetical protein